MAEEKGPDGQDGEDRPSGDLKKGEDRHAKIDTSNLYPGRDSPKTQEQLDDGLKLAKEYYKAKVQPLYDHMKQIVKTASKAEAALTKAKHGDAAKAAAAIAKAADLYAVTCRSID